jgi:MYXO-CTERM domain-containing protein
MKYLIGIVCAACIALAGSAQATIEGQSIGIDRYEIGYTLKPFQARVDKAGIHFRGLDGHRFSMYLAEYGYKGRMQAAQSGLITIADKGVAISHGALTEWYRSAKSGVEQGFTLASRLRGSDFGKPFRLRFKLSGDLVAVQSPSGGIDLRDETGSFQMHYGKLRVVDASGRSLPARMYLNGGDIILTFDDSAAIYPVTIDPLFSAIRQLSAGEPGSELGASIAMSGNKIVVGAPLFSSPYNPDQEGAVVVLKPGKTRGEWDALPRIHGSSGRFGSAVAIANDVLAVGAPLLDSDAANAVGGIFIFHLPISSDSNSQGSADNKLTVQYAAGGEQLGRALALDNNILVAGSVGAVYVYGRTESSKFSSEQVQKLTSSDGTAGDTFGTAVALDGNTVAVGAPTADGGSVYIFNADVNGTFAQSSEVIAPTGAAQFGSAVAMADGVLLVGAPAAGGTGAAYVYVQDEDAITRSAVLEAASVDGADFGASVGVDDGRAIIGAPGINKAFIYADISDGDPKLAHTFKGLSGKFANPSHGTLRGLRFGASVAIEGHVAAVGADESTHKDDDSYYHRGSAYVIEPGIDLSVALRPESVDTTYGGGDTFTFTVTVANNDPTLTAHHVTLVHFFNGDFVGGPSSLPASIISSSVDCEKTPASFPISLNCDIGKLGPGMTRNPSFTAKAPVSGDFEEVFKVHADEADQNDDNNEGATLVHATGRSSESDPPPGGNGGGGAFGLLGLLLLAGIRFRPGRS